MCSFLKVVHFSILLSEITEALTPDIVFQSLVPYSSALTRNIIKPQRVIC